MTSNGKIATHPMMITPEIIRRHHVFGCQLIQDAGIMHKLPQIVMITGQSIFHRFYHKQSIAQYDVFTVAMGSFMLAAKVEEKTLTLKEVIFTFHYLYFLRRGLRRTGRELEVGSELYLSWKNQLIAIEKDILITLGFAVYEAVDHPHQYLLYIIKLLFPSSGSEGGEESQRTQESARKLAQAAWSYLNDSMRIDLELRYDSTYIACAAIFLAARQIGCSLPENPEPWWKTLLRIETEPLLDIANEIMGLYSTGKVDWIQPYVEMSYLNNTAPY